MSESELREIWVGIVRLHGASTCTVQLAPTESIWSFNFLLDPGSFLWFLVHEFMAAVMSLDRDIELPGDLHITMEWD